MKSLLKYMCFLVISLCSCHDDVIEGWVITNPAETMTIRTTDVVCGGEVIISIEGEDVKISRIETGVILQNSMSGVTSTIQSTQITGRGSFSCHLYDLAPNTLYQVQAYAVITRKNKDGRVYESTIEGNTVPFITNKDGETELAPPENLEAFQAGFSISVNWNAPSNASNFRTVSYLIERSDKSDGGYYVLSDNNYYNTYTDIKPLEGINYYRVKAETWDYPPIVSEYAYASCFFVQNDENIAPSAPTGIIAQIDEDCITIKWDKVDNASDYRIYRCVNPYGNYDLIGRCGDINSWTDYYPYVGDNYYKITAIIGRKESKLSDFAHCKFP